METSRAIKILREKSSSLLYAFYSQNTLKMKEVTPLQLSYFLTAPLFQRDFLLNYTLNIIKEVWNLKELSLLNHHPDLLLIKPLEDDFQRGKEYTIKELECLSNFFSLRSWQEEKRFVVIRDAELLKDDLCNKLLKDFEEPPPGTSVFLLFNTIHSILPTLKGRALFSKVVFETQSSDTKSLLKEHYEKLGSEIKEIIQLIYSYYFEGKKQEHFEKLFFSKSLSKSKISSEGFIAIYKLITLLESDSKDLDFLQCEKLLNTLQENNYYRSFHMQPRLLLTLLSEIVYSQNSKN